MATTEIVTETTTNGTDSNVPQTLTLRMIMQGKEAGSIIGKKGDNVRKFREDSGAKINISDSSCPERIVTVTGTTDQIFKAFTMICKKFEEDILNTHNNSTLPKPPVTLRLIVPASQCGSLIGKGGSKIKEIRELTGASIQVASEMLPNSTERAVTVSGTADAITQSIYHICCVMLESPPKGATIPYRPKPAMPPVLLAGGQAFTVQGQLVVPQPHADCQLPLDNMAPYMMCGLDGFLHKPRGTTPHHTTAAQQQHPPQHHHHHPSPHHQQPTHHLPHANVVQFHPPLPPQLTKIALQQGLLGHQPVPIIGTQQGLMPAINAGLQAGMTVFPPQRPAAPGATNNMNTQTHEMTIPNDLIGCIIGRGGAKINEIRQLSGATIKIANADEGSSDRKVTIMGAPETIHAAQYMINASVEMHKHLLAMNELGGLPVSSASPMAAMSANALAAGSAAAPLTPLAIPINQMMKPLAAMPMGLSPAVAVSAPGAVGTIFDGKTLTTKMKTPASMATATMLATAVKKNGNKFAPY